MARTFIGGIVGGIIIFVLGYIFWATPLGEIPYSKANDTQNAAVQSALAQNLTQSGTGTYIIPAHQSAGGAVLYAKGPIATVHFNTVGFSPDDMSMILPGFIVALVTGLLMAFGLAAVGGGGRSFASVGRLVVCFSLAFTCWEFLGSPIFNHYGWRYWIYVFVVENISFVTAGLVIARWFLPRGYAAAEPRLAETSGDDAPVAPVTEG